jgi:protein O-mannosyl-transferase
MIVLLCFWPATRNGFVGYDDPEYVVENPHVNAGLSAENLEWAFTAAHSNNWHPLTWISHQLDSQIYGIEPAGHHLTSVLLHALNTALLFLWLRGVTGFAGRSAFVALAFGIHPLRVESVAWVAERKDVLSGTFWMLTLIAYSAYAKRPGAGRYALVAASLAAGLLSKQMLVTVPLLLLLLDWWPLKRAEPWRRLALEKLPLLGLAAIASAAAFWAQGRAVAAVEDLPAGLRLSNAMVSYVRYLWKMIWPMDLAVFYPFPLAGVPAWQAAGSLVLIGAVSWLAFAARGRRPWLAAGWGWYLLTLLPVIGIVQLGMQSMADRYTYIPMIGLLLAIAWELGSWKPAPALAVVSLIGCAVLTWRQISVWNDGVTLFTHALAVTQNNFVAHNNLGVELDRRGRRDEALEHYRETLRIRPGDRNGEENYSRALFAKGESLLPRGDEALAPLREALRLRPRNIVARVQVGQILTEQKKLDAAVAEFRAALEIDRDYPPAHAGLAVALAHSGDAAGAALEFAEVARLQPESAEAHYNLGLALSAAGETRRAAAAFEQALKLRPDFSEARTALHAISREGRGPAPR